MVVSRRMLMTGVGLAGTAMVASNSEACTIVASLIPIGFSDAECKRSLRRFVSLINEGPKLTDDELTKRAKELAVQVDVSVTDPIFNFQNSGSVEDLELFRAWSQWSGRQDRSPIMITDVNLLKGVKGAAIYQFTLRRDMFHPEITAEEAAGDSCWGSASEAYFGPEVSSYLGFFRNNKLRDVLEFDIWLRTR